LESIFLHEVLTARLVEEEFFERELLGEDVRLNGAAVESTCSETEKYFSWMTQTPERGFPARPAARDPHPSL
jgi:hypothetical protein